MVAKGYAVFEKASDATQKAALVLLSVIMLAMVSFTGLQVACRYIVGRALTWPEEINVFFMVWITFVGSSMAIKKSEHIGVDLFVDMLPRALRLCVRFAGHLVMTYIVLLIIINGYKVAMMNTTVFSDALEIPMVLPRMGLAVGGCMMLVQMIWVLATDLREFCAMKKDRPISREERSAP